MVRDNLERYVIDQSVLFAKPEYDNEIPIVLKGIYLSVQEWGVFDAKKNVTFCENFLRVLEYTIERNLFDIEYTIYWMNVMYRLIDLLKKDYPQIVQKMFVKTQLDDQKNGQVNLTFNKTSPELITSGKGKSRFGKDIDENVMIFTSNIHNLLTKTYLSFLNQLFKNVDQQLQFQLFEITKQKVVNSVTKHSINDDSKLNHLLEILQVYYNEFTKQKIELNIINHFFESLIEHIDIYIFNKMMTEQTFTSKGIQIKMTISSIQLWFEEKSIKSSHKSFLYSREACDVCVIAQKSLLTDLLMRNELCPNLNISQISRLLSNYSEDELDPQKISSSIIQTLQKDTLEKQKYLLSQKIDFYNIYDLKTSSVLKLPLFNMDLNQNRSKLEKIHVEKFTEKKELYFLNN